MASERIIVVVVTVIIMGKTNSLSTRKMAEDDYYYSFEQVKNRGRQMSILRGMQLGDEREDGKNKSRQGVDAP